MCPNRKEGMNHSGFMNTNTILLFLQFSIREKNYVTMLHALRFEFGVKIGYF